METDLRETRVVSLHINGCYSPPQSTDITHFIVSDLSSPPRVERT